MSKPTTLSSAEIERLDQFYREGGLRAMASPHIHHDDSACPHAGCGHQMEWIDFKLELHGDPNVLDKPLVRAWWDGTGFAGRCPGCARWIRFTTMGMAVLVDDEAASPLAMLADDWASNAQFA